MKITDTTGRAMLVDLVYKDPRMGWLQAPEFQLTVAPGSKQVRGTHFVQVPYGQYAIRICSSTGAEVIVHENGERLISTSVPTHTQFITNDAEGQPLKFGAPGATARKSKGNDVALLVDTTGSESSEGATTPSPDSAQIVKVVPPSPLSGHGMVYVVVRFAKNNSPFGEPPQEEFEIAFQMYEKETFENEFANNLRLVAEAPPLPNPRDPMSRVPADVHNEAHPHFNCIFSGRRH